MDIYGNQTWFLALSSPPLNNYAILDVFITSVVGCPYGPRLIDLVLSLALYPWDAFLMIPSVA